MKRITQVVWNCIAGEVRAKSGGLALLWEKEVSVVVHVARFGAKNFVDNDHARADRALGENGHHRKERPQDRGWCEAGSYDAALRSGATISDNAFERLSLI